MIARAILLSVAVTATGCDRAKAPNSQPAGAEASAKTEVLKAGAAAIQGKGPLNGFNVYLVGFHPMKEDPAHQMEAHHFCKQVNEDFAQCVLFDGNTSSANMTGVEYIISEKIFETLPAGERQFWHPHNGEILSGQLVAPGLPGAAEKELMKSKINSYGRPGTPGPPTRATRSRWERRCWAGLSAATARSCPGWSPSAIGRSGSTPLTCVKLGRTWSRSPGLRKASTV